MRKKLLVSTTILAPLFFSPYVKAAGVDPVLEQKYEAAADRLIAKNDFTGAVIELKNAKKANPEDGALRIKLALVELGLNDIDGAQLDLKAARQNGGDEAKIIPLLGRTYMAQGKFEDLLQDMPVRDDAPAENRVAILVARANALMALNRIGDARTALARALALQPEAVAPKLAMAHLDIISNRFDNADKSIDDLLRLAPSAEIYYLKAQILAHKEDNAGALMELNMAIAAEPTYLPALIERAQIFIAQSQDTKADADIKTALALSPKSVAARYFQALLLARAKDYNDADTVLMKYAEGFALFPQGFFLQAVVKSTLKQYEQAQGAINAYLATTPNDIKAQKIQAEIMMRSGNFVAAANVLEKLINQNPGDADSLALLGQAYKPTNSYKSADAFQKAARLAPDNEAVLRELALDHLAIGQNDAGAAELEKAIQIAPDDAASADSLTLLYLRQRKYEDADRLIAAQTAKRPNDPGPADAAALLSMAQGHMAEAKAAFIALEKRFPDFLPAKLQLAQVYVREGNPDQARAEYQDILAKDPVNLQALQNLSDLMLREGQSGLLLDLWKKSFRAQPDNIEIGLGLIKTYVADKDIEAALSVARDMLIRQPKEPRLYSARAELQTLNNQPKDAIESLQRVIELQPDNPVAQRGLALIEEKAGDQTGAMAAIAAARQLDPSSVTLAADEVRMLGSADPQKGIAAARKAAAALPDNAAAQAIEGDYLVFLNRPADALAAFQQAFQAKPSLLLAERMAQTALRLGKPGEGEKMLGDWVDVHPGDLAARFLLANVLQSDKNFAQAKTQYEALLKQTPDNALALNNLAMIYQRDGDARALDTAQKAYLAAPDNPDIADTFGWIMAPKDAAGAVKLLQRAHDAAPADLETQYHLAYALDRKGEKTEASALLKEALAAGKDFDSKNEAQSLLNQLSKK